MRCVTALFLLGSFLAGAQERPTKVPAEQLDKLNGIADQLKAALQHSDLDGPARLASDLLMGIQQQRIAVELSPQQKFVTLEESLPSSGIQRYLRVAPDCQGGVRRG